MTKNAALLGHMVKKLAQVGGAARNQSQAPQMDDAFSALIHWISVTDLEDADVLQVRELVARASDSLDDEDPRLSAVEEIEDLLWSGVVPSAELRALNEVWENSCLTAQKPEGTLLEEEFRQIARTLSESEWATQSYKDAEQALDDLEDGYRGDFEDWLSSMSLRLESSWKTYSQLPLLPEEVTAETVVGHRLLLESIQCWFDALDMLALAADEGTSFDDGLRRAEEGNRLLIAIERLAERTRLAAQ